MAIANWPLLLNALPRMPAPVLRKTPVPRTVVVLLLPRIWFVPSPPLPEVSVYISRTAPLAMLNVLPEIAPLEKFEASKNCRVPPLTAVLPE